MTANEKQNLIDNKVRSMIHIDFDWFSCLKKYTFLLADGQFVDDYFVEVSFKRANEIYEDEDIAITKEQYLELQDFFKELNSYL